MPITVKNKYVNKQNKKSKTNKYLRSTIEKVSVVAD